MGERVGERLQLRQLTLVEGGVAEMTSCRGLEKERLSSRSGVTDRNARNNVSSGPAPVGASAMDAVSASTSTACPSNSTSRLVHDWSAAHAIFFANFSEHDWTTTLALNRASNVRYYTVAHVEPDVSDQTIWVRTACGQK